jgi:hypothetical protein
MKKKQPRRPPSESLPAGGADDDLTPMRKFKTLTRRLLNVSNRQVQAERRQRDVANSDAKDDA